MMRPLAGRPIQIETARFRLRSLTPADISDRWRSWARDPEVMAPLNAPARDMSREYLGNYLSTFDNNNRYIVGVFVKATGEHIGFFVIEVDHVHRCGTFNIVIGENSWWGKGVVNETRAALLDHFFDKLGMRKACGGPLSRNFPSIFNYKAQRWIHEATLRGHFRSVVDGARLDQLLFRLFADEWRAVRNKGRGT